MSLPKAEIPEGGRQDNPDHSITRKSDSRFWMNNIWWEFKMIPETLRELLNHEHGDAYAMSTIPVKASNRLLRLSKRGDRVYELAVIGGTTKNVRRCQQLMAF